MAFGSFSIIQPDGQQRELRLSPGGLRIGSAPDNDLAIAGSGIAPYHAVITCGADVCQITDIGSGDGTLLDGARLLINIPQELEPGDIIQIGDYILYYHEATGHDAEAAPPPAAAPHAQPAPLPIVAPPTPGERQTQPLPTLQPLAEPASDPGAPAPPGRQTQPLPTLQALGIAGAVAASALPTPPDATPPTPEQTASAPPASPAAPPGRQTQPLPTLQTQAEPAPQAASAPQASPPAPQRRQTQPLTPVAGGVGIPARKAATPNADDLLLSLMSAPPAPQGAPPKRSVMGADLLSALLNQNLPPPPPIAPPTPPPSLPPPAATLHSAPTNAQPVVSIPPIVQITLSPPQVQAAPGEIAMIIISVINRSTLLERVTFELTGIPPGGYTFTPTEVRLAPGAQSDVQLELHPPRGHVARTGTYLFRVIARAGQGPPAIAEGVLEVLPAYDYALALAPKIRTAASGASYQLTIANDSNTDLPLTLMGQDPEGALRFHFPRPQVVAPPGTDLVVPVRVNAGSGLFFGKGKAYPFTITATPAFDATRSQMVDGQLVRQPPLPPALMKLLLLLMGGLLACGVLMFASTLACGETASAAASEGFLARFFPFCQNTVTATAPTVVPALAETLVAVEAAVQGTSGAQEAQIALATAVQATQVVAQAAAEQAREQLAAEQAAAATQAAQAREAAASSNEATREAVAAAFAQTQTAIVAQATINAAPRQTAIVVAGMTQTAVAAQLTAFPQTQTANAIAATQTQQAKPTITPTPTPSNTPTATATGTPTNTPTATVIVPVNNPPTISRIGDQITSMNAATAPITFTVSDGETPLSDLMISGSSSNVDLLPNANIVFGGSSANRTVRLFPATDRIGSATVTIGVSDGTTTSTTNFVLTVNPINVPPTIANLRNLTTNEDVATAPITFTVDDLETAVESLTILGVAGVPALVPSENIVITGTTVTRTLVITPALDQWGTTPINVRVSDGIAVTTGTFTLVIQPVNDAPSFTRGPDQTVAEDSGPRTVANWATAILKGGAPTDVFETGQTLSFIVSNTNTLLFAPTGQPRIEPNGTLAYTPAPNATGMATVTVQLKDNGGTLREGQDTSPPETFTISVTPVNDAPTISEIGDQETNEDTTTPAISFTVGDIETPPEELTVTANSANPGRVPNGNIVVSCSGATCALVITPTPNQSGNATITVTVSDGQATDSTTFVLRINNVNDPPTISDIPNQTINENATTGPLAFTINDPDGDNLTLSGSSSNRTLVPNSGAIIFNLVSGGPGARTVIIDPANNESGTTTITISVTDGTATASDSFVLTVNGRPAISDIANQTTDEDTPKAITFTVTDEAPDTLILSGTSSNQTRVPDGNIVFSGSGTNRTVTITPAANQSGNATITISVRDTGGLSRSDQFDLMVNAVNDAPTISDIPDQTTIQNTSIGPINFTVGDVDNQPGSLNVSGTSSDTTLVPNNNIDFNGSGTSRTVTITPANNQLGTTTITISVSDGTSTTTDTFVLTVDPFVMTNSAPVQRRPDSSVAGHPGQRYRGGARTARGMRAGPPML